MGPIGATEVWIRSNKIGSRPAWLASEEVVTHNKIMNKKGYRGPLNWYDVSPHRATTGLICDCFAMQVQIHGTR